MQATSLPLGAAVFTADEVRLGTVSRLEGAFFEVHSEGRGSDYWLEGDCAVANPISGRVTVAFTHDEIKEHSLHMRNDLAGRPAFVPDRDPRTIDERLANPPHEGREPARGSLLDTLKNALTPGTQELGDESDLAGLLDEMSQRLDNLRAGDVMSLRSDPERRMQTQRAIEVTIARLREFQGILV